MKFDPQYLRDCEFYTRYPKGYIFIPDNSKITNFILIIAHRLYKFYIRNLKDYNFIQISQILQQLMPEISSVNK